MSTPEHDKIPSPCCGAAFQVRTGLPNPATSRDSKERSAPPPAVPPILHPLHPSYANNPLLFAQHHLNFQPDPIQSQILASPSPYIILNCSRQWGKTTVIAIKTLHFALFHPRTTTLVAAPSERQSAILLRRLQTFLQSLSLAPAAVPGVPFSLLLPNSSEIVALPASADTIRGFTAHLLIFDEAARVPDSLYQALSPTRATTAGPLWLLSTPNGPDGFFYDAWHAADAERLIRRKRRRPLYAEDPSDPIDDNFDLSFDDNPDPANRERTRRVPSNDAPLPTPDHANRERRERVSSDDALADTRLPAYPERTERVPNAGLDPSRHYPQHANDAAGLSDQDYNDDNPHPDNRERRERVSTTEPNSGLDVPTSPPWTRFLVPASQCSRITPEFLAHERLMLGDEMFRQEYLCEFITPGGFLLSRELIESAIDPSIKPLFPGPVFSSLSWSDP